MGAAYCVVYNPDAANGRGRQNAEKIREYLPGCTLRFVEKTEIRDWQAYFREADPSENIVLTGGDGTLNRFANETEDCAIKAGLFYFPCGTGNDFYRDIAEGAEPKPVPVNQYLRNLPQVTVNGKTYFFVNNVGFGIDGYCCQEGDRLRMSGAENISYASIAIRGLLGKFTPRTAVITVDGKTETFRHVWLAPVMNGRFYGGGMMAAPEQDRSGDTLSLLVMHGASRLATLCIFPSIFKGKHIRYRKHVSIFSGHTITVEFDRPCALQIDGETILNVKSFRAEKN